MIAVLNKLRRIKSKLSGTSDKSVEVPYSVRCDCGEDVTGIRRASWIEAECPQCYQSVFILPVNCYPSTDSVPSEVLDGSLSKRIVAAVNELLPGQKSDSSRNATPAKSVKSPPNKGSAVEETPEQSASPRSQSESARPRLQFPRIDVARILRRTFTPFRLLMLAMISVLSLTGYWMIIQSRLENAQQSWLTATEKASELLKEGDLLALETALNDAVTAGHILGKSDEEWRSTLNLLYETRAVNNLASRNLLNAFYDAYNQDNKLVPRAEDRVTDVINSGYFVIDSWLMPGEGDTFLVEFPATPGLHSIRMHLPFPAIKNLLTTAPDGRILFAARFHDVKPPGTTNDWHLLADPESFVLLTSEIHCEAIGLTVQTDPQISALLNHQQTFVQTSPDWEHRAAKIVLPRVYQEVAGESK